MNRRQFLFGAAATTLSAGGIALLEQELWKPTKTIVLPPKQGWVAGSYGVAFYDNTYTYSGMAPSVLAGHNAPYPTMAAAMRAAEGWTSGESYYDRYQERWMFTARRPYVIWTRPAGSQTRKVIYNSCS